MSDIYIGYGKNMQQTTFALMEAADIASRLSSGMTVCIKPNLVVARPADGCATTHPEIVEGIIQYVQQAGVKKIIIAEGSWVGDSTERAWRSCGYADLAQKYGVTLVDTKKDKVTQRRCEDMKISVCDTPAHADY